MSASLTPIPRKYTYNSKLILGQERDPAPSLAKQLERNGQLPPGLEKRELPSDLSSRLPKRLLRQKRIIVDNDVVLIEEASGLILDVLKDVF